MTATGCIHVLGDKKCGFNLEANPGTTCDKTWQCCQRLGCINNFGGSVFEAMRDEEKQNYRIDKHVMIPSPDALRRRVIIGDGAIIVRHVSDFWRPLGARRTQNPAPERPKSDALVEAEKIGLESLKDAITVTFSGEGKDLDHKLTAEIVQQVARSLIRRGYKIQMVASMIMLVTKEELPK